MPFLDAKALDTDPDGMAFLRSVIRPGFEREQSAAPPRRKESEPCVRATQDQTETPAPLVRMDPAAAAPAA